MMRAVGMPRGPSFPKRVESEHCLGQAFALKNSPAAK